jgi:hypothetical protein
MSILHASILLAPPAFADSTDSLRAAAMSVRSASCGPLRSDPLVQRATEIANQSSDAWLNQVGRAAPPDDILPILKDLGYAGAKAVQLRGAGVTDARAIKGLVLQGYLDLPDCSYTVYGADVLQNRQTGYFLTALVLAA